METQEAVKEVTPAEEPSISPENITEEQLRAMAAEADGIPFKASSKANPEPEVAAQDSQEASENNQPEAKGEEKDSDESAPKAEEKADSKPEERKASEASEVRQEKLDRSAREQIRLSESWKRLEAEKAQVRALQAELENIRQEAQRASDPLSPTKPDELRQFARKWDDEGRDDLAKAARQQADILERKIKDQAEHQEKSVREFRETWDSNVRRAVSENPELQDPSSDLAQKVQYILNNDDPEVRRLIHGSANGIIYASQIAKMMEAAEASEALRSEVENLRKENTELRKKTSLSAGSTAKASPKRKSFEEMSYQEQEEFLRRSASDSDRLGVLIGD